MTDPLPNLEGSFEIPHLPQRAMKLPAIHLAGLVLGGALGYLLALPAADPPSVVSSPTVEPTLLPPVSYQPAWKTQVTTIRKVPASQSETAWVKWAFAIPDQDIPDAIAELNPLTDFHALRVLFSRWATLDAPAAWKSFAALPIPITHLSWYGDHENKELSLGGGTLSSRPKPLIAGRMFYSWYRVEPDKSLAYAKKMMAEKRSAKAGNSGGGDFYITQFIQEKSKTALGEAPPVPTAEKLMDLLSQPNSEGKEKSLRESLGKWAEKDANAAARWWLSLSGDKRQAVNPHLLGKAVFQHGDTVLKTEFLAAGLRSITNSAEEISTFHQRKLSPDYFGNEDSTIHFKNTSAALIEWAAKDTAAAHTWLAAQPDDPLKSFLTGEWAGNLARTSPVNAIALLADVPAENLQVAVSGLTSGWMQQDAAACAAWVAKIEDPALRDSCQQNMARSIMASDPALALRLSTQITNDEVRQEIQNQITQGLSWNPAGLEKIIAANPAVQASLARKPVAN
jgi:hypothetical protein